MGRLIQTTLGLLAFLFVFSSAEGQVSNNDVDPLAAIDNFSQNQSQGGRESEQLSDESGEILQSPEDQILSRIKSERVEIENLLARANLIMQNISSSGMTLSTQYFNIFALIFTSMLAIAGLAAGLVSAIMLKGVRGYINKAAEQSAKKEIDSLIEKSSHIVVARAHAQQSYVWWEHYHEQYKRFLHGEVYNEDISKDARVAFDLARKGLMQLDRLMDSHTDANLDLLKLRANLVNLWVYNRTAQLLLNQSKGDCPDESDINDLLDMASECLKNSRDKGLLMSRHNYAETANFALLKFGDETLKRQAKKGLIEVLTGNPRNSKQAPSSEWLTFAREYYFPIGPCGSRRDVHQLGKIPDLPGDAKST